MLHIFYVILLQQVDLIVLKIKSFYRIIIRSIILKLFIKGSFLGLHINVSLKHVYVLKALEIMTFFC